MAIPFVMPDDENVNTEEVIRKIQVHLTRQVSQIRSTTTQRPNNSSQPVFEARNRTNNRSNNIEINITRTSTDNNLSSPDGVTWVTYRDGNTTTQLSTTTTRTVARISRRRTISETSCCEETKISITPLDSYYSTNIQTDWNQVGQILREVGDDFEQIQINYKSDVDDETIPESKKTCSKDSLLSRLVPDLLSSSFWTAIPVICAVGWHLLRTR